MRYNEADQITAGLRGEWRTEDSDCPDNALDRDTWLVSGFYENQVSEDGRDVETRLGYVWRPADNDRVNALLSYTYLYDLPGADQVSIDGDINGPRQKSHILNAAINWQFDPTWTVGAKCGYRMRDSAERGSGSFTRSEAHLAALRADYHIVQNWDVMGEVRALSAPQSDTIETSALIGAYRLVGDHVRVGGGHLWGKVDDDLRKIDTSRTGFFLNITAQF